MHRHSISRTVLFAAASCMAAGAFFIWLAQSFNKASGEEPAKADVKWEYCSIIGDGLAGRWETGDKVIEGLGYGEIAKAMGLTLRDDDKNGTIKIFNHLGAQGWELVSDNSLTKKDGDVIRTCTFKRKVR